MAPPGRGRPASNAALVVTLVLFLGTLSLFVANPLRDFLSPGPLPCTETAAATAATPSIRGGSEHGNETGSPSDANRTAPPRLVGVARYEKVDVPSDKVDVPSDKVDVPSLESLLGKSGSDKAMPGNGGGHHGYARYYERVLAPIRAKPVRFVEIGVERGFSLKVWQQYFSNADHVYGIGYGNFQKTPSQECESAAATKVESDAPCTLFKGDQSDVAFLRHFLNETGGDFHVILDDGSHVPSHQVTSFETLWPAVRPGGMYIVEDIETNWWDKPNAQVYGYKLAGQVDIVEKWKGVVDAVNREYTRGRSPLTDENAAIYGKVTSVEFGQNVIIFHKAMEGEERLLERPYRWHKQAHQN